VKAHHNGSGEGLKEAAGKGAREFLTPLPQHHNDFNDL
jgi:hypothetical protein